MADAFGAGLVVWDNGRLYRLESQSFNLDPTATHFVFGQSSGDMPANIVGMDITPVTYEGEQRYLYYRPLASHHLFAANTTTLKNPRSGIKIIGAENVLSSQAVGMAFSSRGTLFLGMSKESGIACWNQYRPIRENIVS